MALNWIQGSKNRKKQIQKVINYAREILKIKVQFVKSAGGFSGLYSIPTETSEAKVEIAKCSSPLKTLFTLLHEIGHHIDFIKRGSPRDEEQAYNRYPDSALEAPCPKEYAEKINYVEEQAIKNGLELADFLDITLPVYSTMQDVFYSREMLNLHLKKGFTNEADMIRIRVSSGKKAKRILSESKYKRINYSICCQ